MVFYLSMFCSEPGYLLGMLGGQVPLLGGIPLQIEQPAARRMIVLLQLPALGQRHLIVTRAPEQRLVGRALAFAARIGGEIDAVDLAVARQRYAGRESSREAPASGLGTLGEKLQAALDKNKQNR